MGDMRSLGVEVLGGLVGSSGMLVVSVGFLSLSLSSVGGEEELMGVGVFMDSLSGMLIMLTVWLCLSIFVSGSVREDLVCKSLVMGVGIVLVVCFMVGSVFMFYIFFEVVLFPMFLMMILYGGYSERVEGGFYMMFYTMTGSLPLLMVVVSGSGESSWSFSMSGLNKGGGESSALMMLSAFFSKLPLYGFHIWLPKAHVEAPVVGSMLLAGVLLKLGGFGILRVLWFSQVGLGVKSLVSVVGVVGGVNCGLACMRQNDVKKLVAYSSVVHSGMMVSGMMTYMDEGWGGGVSMMVCHGVCSSGLFFYVNMIYERVFSRSISLIKGCGGFSMGVWLWCFLLVVVNMGCPPFFGFFAESLLCMSLLKWSVLWSVLLSSVLFLSVGYNMYLYTMINHGGSDVVVSSGVVVEYLLLFLHLLPGSSLVSKMGGFMMM